MMALPKTSSISELLEPMLKEFEGIRLHSYWDGKQFSIGYGSGTYENGRRVQEGDVITAARAIKIMQADLNRTRFPALQKYVKVPLTPGMAAALTSFCYNKGVGGLRDSTIVQLLNAGASKERVAKEFAFYNKNAAGVKKDGLTRRRAAEAKVFLS